MRDLIEFLTSEEIMIVYVLIAAVCMLSFIIWIIDKKKRKRKLKNNTKELYKLTEAINEKLMEGNETIKTEVKTPVVEASKVEESKTEEPKVEEVAAPSVEEIKVKEEIPIFEEVAKVEEPKVEVAAIEPIVNETPEKVEEEITYEEIVDEKSNAQQELEKLTEELRKAQEMTENVENIDLTDFEEEQEKNSIISLDELMAKANQLYEINEEKQYVDEGNEPISIMDLEKKYKEQQKPVIEVVEPTEVKPNVVQAFVNEVIKTAEPKLTDTEVLDKVKEIREEQSSNSPNEKTVFKNSPFISPIFGIENKQINKSAEMELENTANYDKLDEEIRKTNEFLNTLKELKKKLD